MDHETDPDDIPREPRELTDEQRDTLQEARTWADPLTFDWARWCFNPAGGDQ